MNKTKKSSNDNFWKIMTTIIIGGTLLILAVYFGKKYKASQKTVEITKFYNQFSDDDYIDFAKQLEASIYENRLEEFNKKVNIASLLNFSNQELAGSYKKRTAVNFLKSYIKIGNSITNQLARPKDFKYLNFYKKEGVPHIVFRVYRSDIINFMDFTLGIKKDKIIINDIYNFFSGVAFSEMASKLYYEAMNEENQSFEAIRKYQSVQNFISIGDYESAYDLLKSIGIENRNDNHYGFLLITASNLSFDLLLEVITEMKTQFSEDERLQAYLDFHEKAITGDLKDLSAAAEHLKKYTGDDIVYDLYKGIYFYLKNEYEEALIFFNRTIQKDPTFFDAYNYKLFSLLMLNEEEKALNVLVELKKDFSISEETIILELQDFPEFIASEAFQNTFKNAE
ncbi:hypothetical protein C8N46_111101 [Kordia periserrulae]|uniref:Tetratricopeptide repeat protein n=1 Tax=Kordia periserrulae TaxID=701523 RepID=A0A2T6BSI1_9FLAO|nr:hypothetical protein [Kordia periserrulae]PTX59032.1 hypothetical protein C8N46_111101 [Kordia periserrulae]